MESEAIGIADSSRVVEQPFVTDLDLEGRVAISLPNPGIQTTLRRRHIERDVARAGYLGRVAPRYARGQSDDDLFNRQARDRPCLRPRAASALVADFAGQISHPDDHNQRASDLLPTAARLLRPPVPHVQVPHDGAQCGSIASQRRERAEGPDLQELLRPANHAGRSHPAVVQHRRDAASIECRSRPEVTGRTTAPLASEVARYEPWQRQRLAVKSGLTCLWQLSGRSEIGFDRWVAMDLWYLENQSLKTDVSLLLRAVERHHTARRMLDETLNDRLDVGAPLLGLAADQNHRVAANTAKIAAITSAIQ